MSQFPMNRRIWEGNAPDAQKQMDGGIGPSPQVVEQQQQPQMNREQWRDAWMGAGQMSPDEADKWLSSHGAQQLGEKAGVWRTPSGDVLDLQIGRGGAKATGGKITPGWTPVGQGGFEQNQPQQMGGAMGQMPPGTYQTIGPQMSRAEQFAQMFGNPQNRLKQQGFSPS